MPKADLLTGAVNAILNPNVSWWHFGDRAFECNDADIAHRQFYLTSPKGKPPRFLPPCDTCWKALLLWHRQFSISNLESFIRALPSLGSVRGKLNDDVVVFYFTSEDDVITFLPILNEVMRKHAIQGYTQWRRACKGYQDDRPNWWYNAKELKNVE